MSQKKKPFIAKGKDAGRPIKMPPRPDSSERRLHDIVSTVGDWIWETNEILELTFISDRFEETTGLVANVLLGKSLQQVVLADDNLDDATNPVLFTLDHREPFKDIACSLIDANGQVLHFTLTGIPYYSDNNMFRGYRGAAHNITSQLETQRKYHEVKAGFFPSLAEASADETLRLASSYDAPNEAFVIYDEHGKVTAASEGYAELYPALSDVIIPGKSLREILAQAAERFNIKEARDNIDQWVEQKLDERLHSDNTHQEIFRGGRWWRIHEQRTREGQTLSLHTDITHIKSMERMLLDSQNRYKKLIELAPDLTCVVMDGVITLMNAAGADMLGADKPDDFIGKRFSDYVHPDFRSVLNESIEHLFEERWTPMRLVHKLGHNLDAEVAALPFGEEGLHSVMFVARDTSERKRAAEAIINRDFQLQAIMQTVPDGIITIDERGIVKSFNKEAEKIFGYQSSEIINHNVSLLMPEPYAHQHNDHLKLFTQTRQETLTNKTREFTGRRKDGSVFPIEMTLSELRQDRGTLFIGVARDISERRAAEEELRESRERLRLAIRGAGEGIWDWNVKKDQIYISKKIRFLTGLKTEFVKSRAWLHLIHPDDRPGYREQLIRHLKGETPSFSSECRLLHKDGSECWIRISGMAMRDINGFAYRLAGSVGDITERIAFQHEIIEAKDRAEVASRVKSEFLANMSHELRTPLNAIIGFSDVMLSGLFGGIEPRYMDYLENIRDSGSHLLGIINDILDVSRIEAGHMELHPERCTVEELIEAAMRLVRDRANDGEVTLTKTIASQLPNLMVDNQRIKQVLLNILSNAVKFTPPNGKVHVKAFMNDDGELVISVVDTGIGMDEDAIAIALTPFGQVDSRLTRKYEGTGLGLPLTKSFVELHDSRMTIESELEKGTTVSIAFPHTRLMR